MISGFSDRLSQRAAAFLHIKRRNRCHVTLPQHQKEEHHTLDACIPVNKEKTK